MENAKLIDWVRREYNNLICQSDSLSRYIVSIYIMLIDLRSGGVLAYLNAFSADNLSVVKDAFKVYGFSDGLDWLDGLERAYGQEIHATLDERDEHIMNMPEAEQDIRPFQKEDKALLVLLPKIDDFLLELVKKKITLRS